MSTIAFYNGAAGMIAYQNALNVTGHNIANVQTNGYKNQRAAFDALLYTRMNTNVEGEHLVGHSVKQEYVDQIMLQSSLDQTYRELDFALVGNGFFQVEDDGQLEYTRNGNFQLSVEGTTATLVTNDGAYVLGTDGQRITIPQQPDGSYDYEGITQRLGVYRFPNQWGLIPQNNARYTESDNSGAAVLTSPADVPQENPLEVLQGALERSSVDLATEMVNMITYQRSFQINSRVLQTADEIAQEINNLR